jgi:putative membrane protein
MNFSQKAKEHIDSCRFCWMCHHVCPVGNATGLERNTARARALGLSLVARGAVEYSEDIINNVYECTLCGGCMTDCVTGWDPVMFAKEARLGAALDGKLPEYVLKMINNLTEKGSIYGAEQNPNIPVFKDKDTLFFLGEDTRAKGCAKAAVELLQKAGVKFALLENEPNSGASMNFLVGAANETKSMMEECTKILSSYKTVICYDPYDADVILREYKEWGIDVKAEVKTFTSYVAELIENGALKIKNNGKSYTPQDSPYLARDLEETQPIRKILSACGTVNEMLLNREHTVLAGQLIMGEYMNDVIEKIASDRWSNAKNMNTKTLVTASTAEYEYLSRTKPEGMELLKIEEVVLQCL